MAAKTRLQLCVLVAMTLLNRTYGNQLGNDVPLRPNILLILVDDLGFSDIGCYGGEIATPNLDMLAANGLQLTQFYNSGRCWPTRGSLLTGFYAQQIRRDKIEGLAGGGQGQRPSWARLLPSLLREVGYRTYHSGKWHIDGLPLQNGFDRSYLLKDQHRFFSPTVHRLDDEPLPAVDPDSGFYGTIAITDHAVDCLVDHTEDHLAKPFFQFLAFTAPHFPLQALPQDIARYQDKYQPGWEVIRRERFARQTKEGLLNCSLSAVERTIGPPYHFPDALAILGPGEVNRPLRWNELTAEQRRFQGKKMAIHAAMVDRIDQEVGRVLKQLKSMRAFERTLILFLSDNGASAEIMVRGDGHDAAAPAGSRGSHLCLGPGWSTTCNTPFRRHKTWVHEGGIATPMIIHWPQVIAPGRGLRTSPGHVVDVVPTLLELTGAKMRDSAAKSPGRSLVPLFKDDVHIERDSIWWSHEGNRAIRVGNKKLVAAKDEPWELYDLAVDRAETNDLANNRPEVVRTLERLWQSKEDGFRADLSSGP